MAIFGPFSTVKAQLAMHAQFDVPMQFVAEAVRSGSDANRRLMALRAGESEKIELPGGAYAINQAYETKPRSDGFFEAHRKYIDIQVVVDGAEAIEVEDIARLKVTQEYNEERDYLKLAENGLTSRLVMQAGDVAVLFPADGHMPSVTLEKQPLLVRKTVVKVPVN